MEYSSNSLKIKNFYRLFFPVVIGFFVLFFVTSCSNGDTSTTAQSGGNNPPPAQKILVIGTATPTSVTATQDQTPLPNVTLNFKTLVPGTVAELVTITDSNQWLQPPGVPGCTNADHILGCSIILSLDTTTPTNGPQALNIPFSVTNGTAINSPLSIQYNVTPESPPGTPTVTAASNPINGTVGTKSTIHVTFTVSGGPVANLSIKNISDSATPSHWDTINAPSDTCSSTCTISFQATPTTPAESGNYLNITYTYDGAQQTTFQIPYVITSSSSSKLTVTASPANFKAQLLTKQSVVATFQKINPSDSFNYFVTSIGPDSKKEWAMSSTTCKCDIKNNSFNSCSPTFDDNNQCTVTFDYFTQTSTPTPISTNASVAFSYEGSTNTTPFPITYTTPSNLKWIAKTLPANAIGTPARDDKNNIYVALQNGGIAIISDSGSTTCTTTIPTSYANNYTKDSVVALFNEAVVVNGTVQVDIFNTNCVNQNHYPQTNPTAPIVIDTGAAQPALYANPLLVYGNTGDGKIGNIIFSSFTSPSPQTGLQNYFTIPTSYSPPPVLKMTAVADVDSSGKQNGHVTEYIVSKDAKNNSLLSAWSFSCHMWDTATSQTTNPTTAVLSGNLSTPAVTANSTTIYIGSDSGTLYALNSKDGTAKWTKPFQGQGNIFAQPTIDSNDNKTIYFGTSGTSGGSVYTINTADGTQKWKWTNKSQNNASIFGSPVIGKVSSNSKNAIFVASSDGNLYALNSADGTELWEFDTGNQIQTQPVLNAAGDTIYFGDNKNNFYAVNIPSIPTQSQPSGKK